MDFSKISLFSMMQQRMRYLSERQTVVAQNIANVDTPGYKPKDLKPLQFNDMVKSSGGSGISPAATHPTHMSLGGGSGSFKTTNQRNVYEITPTGNAVSVEEQALNLAQIQMEYQTTTSMYRKMTTMMTMALGDAGK